jgi:hypothetical protein
MTPEEREKYGQLCGLFAYDTGCVDSGVKDDVLKAHLQTWLHEQSEAHPDKQRIFLARCVQAWVTEEMIALRYGAEDVAKWFRWLADEMGFDL